MYATVGIFELIKIAAIEVGFVSAATDSSHCCFMKHSLRLFRPYQGWAKLVLIALERYSVELKRLTFNFR